MNILELLFEMEGLDLIGPFRDGSRVGYLDPHLRPSEQISRIDDAILENKEKLLPLLKTARQWRIWLEPEEATS